MGKRISIDRFCGFSSAVIDIYRLTVLVGEQASGKSLIAKINYFFEEVCGGLFVTSVIAGGANEYKNKVAAKFKEYFPPSAWGDGVPFSVSFYDGDFSVVIKGSPKKRSVKVFISDGVLREIDKIKASSRKLGQHFGQKFLSTVDEFWVNRYYSRVVGQGDRGAELLFVPAGRCFFSALDRAVWPILQRQKSVDPFLIHYGLHYEEVKSEFRYRFMNHPRKPTHKAEDMLWSALGGEFVVQREEEFLRMSDGRLVPVANLSSGQQELLPILLGVFPGGKTKHRRCVFIEEPEAHLFPSAQKSVVEFIAFGFNVMSKSSSVLMTTHSPYVLASINNLLAAGTMGRKRSMREKVLGVYQKDYWLTYADVGCYSVSGGRVDLIMDDEFKMIDSSYIDSVSSDISMDFDRIMGWS